MFRKVPLINITRQFKTVAIKKELNISEKISQNNSLRKYIKDIYIKTGCGFTASLATSMVIPFVALTTEMPLSVMCGIWLGNVGFNFYSSHKMLQLETNTIEKEDGLYEEYNLKKERWYKVFCISNGIILSPVIGITMITNLIILPTALTATASTFAGATYVALNQKDLNLVQYQGPLIGGVWGLIGASLVPIGAHLCGFHTFGSTLDLIITGGSVIIFSSLIAVETQVAIKNYNDKQLDSIIVSLKLLLNASILLIDFINILEKIRRKY
jgi:FtsH-binding integral membrane protein